jgi:hypothetical protein
MTRPMVKRRQPQVSGESMLGLIAVAEAARLSQKRRKRVYLKEVLS